MIGYVWCDTEVSCNLRIKFANFPTISKNTPLSKTEIGDLMKTYAKEKRRMSQPRENVISNPTFQNGTFTTPLLLFYLQLSLICTKIHRFVENAPKKNFNSFGTVSSWRKNTKWRESKLHYSRWDLEAASE